MVLPRFRRLPGDEQSRVLAVAADHLAERGLAVASLLDIAEAAGLSRSAMYNYFDGRDDLIDAVREDARRQVAAALGDWTPGATVGEFWDGFHAGVGRLGALLAARPALRAVLAETELPADDAWLTAFVANATALGLLPAGDRELALAVTAAVLSAVDRLELAEPGRVPPERVEALLSAVWSATA